MDYIKDKQKKLAESLGVECTHRVPIELEKPTSSLVKSYAVMIIGLIFIIFHMGFSVVKVSGPSMLPTLKHNDYMLLSKYDQVDRFDVVVLKERLTEGGDTKNIVKRVIGMGGERVTVVNGQLFIDNVAYNEYYLDNENIKAFGNTSFDITVPDGYYFVMGDNRDVSKDSRTVGSFKKDAVIGVDIHSFHFPKLW